MAPGRIMADITRLPGEGCRHHENGRCLYEEHLNPGYDPGFKCRVLARWESAFDEFLARAECFGVEQQAMPDLWRRQFGRLARKTFHCDEYEYCAEAEVPACLHALGGLCRLGLPECEGRCHHFQIKEPEEQA